MLRKSLLVLYTALTLGANPLAAQTQDMQTISTLRTGDMKKLVLHDSPRPLPNAILLDAADGAHALADYHGKWVVLNFWAVWCAPCRKEMPSLDRLQAALPELTVLPIASGPNAVPRIERFYREIDLKNLPILRDPESKLTQAAGVLGFPVTLILNPKGEEVARLIGDADWDSDSAKAILTALITAHPEDK